VRAAEARAREQRSSRGGFSDSLSANSMVSRASFQGSTMSSARRGAAEATVVMRLRLWRGEPEGEVVKRRQRL
jgi:hypothetical protein